MTGAVLFQRLHIELTVVSYHEISGGELQLVAHLEAIGFGSRPALLEVLRKRWKEEDGTFEPEWRSTRAEISMPSEAVHRLVESLRAAAPQGRPPRVSCRPTGRTVWDGVTLGVSLDDSDWILRLVPADGMTGDEAPAVRAIFRELAGLTEPQGEFPVELLAP